MFERFTNDSRRVLVIAAEGCKAMGHFQITPAHLLLGLFDVPGSSEVLREHAGLSRKAFEDHLAASWPQSERVPKNPPFASDAKKVLEEALRQAIRLGDNGITPAHLLLGVLVRSEGVDVEWLQDNAKGGLLALHDGIEQVRAALAEPAARGLQRAALVTQPVTEATRQALAGSEGTLDTGKLLLSLVQQQGSAAAQALEKLGVTPDALADAVSAVNTAGTNDEPPLPPAVRLIDQTGQSLVVEAGDLLHFAAETASDMAAQGLASATTASDGSVTVELNEGTVADVLAGFADWQAKRSTT